MIRVFRSTRFKSIGLLALMTGVMAWLLMRPLAAEEQAPSFEQAIAQAAGFFVASPDDPPAQAGSQVVVDPQTTSNLKVRISWGHRSVSTQPFRVSLLAERVQIAQMKTDSFEAGDELQDAVCQTRAGAGDVDALTADVAWTKPMQPPLQPHSIWQALLDNGEPGQVARLKDDPGLTPDAPVLTVLTAADGTRGFSFGLEQLVRHKAMWLPEHDLFVTLADAPVDFTTHLNSLQGERVLDRVRHQPEATLVEWTNKWADFGNPTLPHHGQETELLGAKGHLTGFAARHGAIYKFGIDRWGRARPDLSFAHKFRFDPLWTDWQWTDQRIVDGLPILVTTCDRQSQHCEIEQIVVPLTNAPRQRGDIPSVLLSRFRFTGAPGPLQFGFLLATENAGRHPELREVGGRWRVVDRETGNIWLMLESSTGLTLKPRAAVADAKDPRVAFDCTCAIQAGQTCEILMKLPSPTINGTEAEVLAKIL